MLVYLSMILYIRRAVKIEQRRQIANNRDAIVLKRILIVYIASLLAGFPTVIILMTY